MRRLFIESSSETEGKVPEQFYLVKGRKHIRKQQKERQPLIVLGVFLLGYYE